MRHKQVPAVLLASITLSACGPGPQSNPPVTDMTEDMVTDQPADSPQDLDLPPAANRAPGAPEVTLTPEDPTTTDALQARATSVDPDGDRVSFTYAWFRDDEQVEALNGDGVPAELTVRGQTWRVEVTPNDGELTGIAASANVTISNTAPSPPGEVRITPEGATEVDDLTCAASGSRDPDMADTVTYTYQWFRADMELQGQTDMVLGADQHQVGDVITCAATATDGTDASKDLTSSPVTIEDTFTGTQTGRIKSSNIEVDDLFGTRLKLAGDRAIVGTRMESSCAGTPASDNNCSEAGAAYIFERDASGDWTQVAMLKASNAEAEDSFGSAVDIEGDTAVVGAFGEDDCLRFGPNNNRCSSAGAVYVFERDASGTWSQTAQLKARNAGPTDRFGSAVSLSGDRVIVGAHGESSCVGAGEMDNSCLGAGAVYVFEMAAMGRWLQDAMLKSINGGQADQFGISVSLSGDRALIGAPQEDSCKGSAPNTNGCPNAGATYVFDRLPGGMWVQAAMLKASNADESDRFGSAVSLSGERALIGALQESSCTATDPSGNNCPLAGAAYIYERAPDAEWNEQALLKSPDLAEYDTFGESVSLSGQRALVGASGENDCVETPPFNLDCEDAGAAYIFERGDDVWTSAHKLTASDAGNRDRFGRAVSLSNNHALIAAPRESSCFGAAPSDTNCRDAGVVYVFE